MTTQEPESSHVAARGLLRYSARKEMAFFL